MGRIGGGEKRNQMKRKRYEKKEVDRDDRMEGREEVKEREKQNKRSEYLRRGTNGCWGEDGRGERR